MNETPVGLSERAVAIVIGLVGGILLIAVTAFALWIAVTNDEPVPDKTGDAAHFVSYTVEES